MSSKPVCCVKRRLFAMLFAGIAAASVATVPACGDVYESSGVITCDAEYCIDCVDSCCYDVGYC